MDILMGGSGYGALFLISFLAATLLPLGSEWLLVLLLLKGADPLLTVAAATAGNTLGALVTYGIGLWGASFLMERVLRMTVDARDRAQRFYHRYGSWSLLFSWLPVVGDPLCLAGGVMGIPFLRFFLMVLAGKLGRYTLLSVLVRTGAG